MLNRHEEKPTVLFENNDYSILKCLKPGNKMFDTNIYLLKKENNKQYPICSLFCDKEKGIQDYLEYNGWAIAILRNDDPKKSKCQSAIKIFFIKTLASISGNEEQMEILYKSIFGEDLDNDDTPKIKTYYL